jgi:hypothetical protein
MKGIVTKMVASLVLYSAIPAGAATTRYVDVNCPSPVAPYTSWATAATNIQDAIDAANSGDLVLVTNGVYANGGKSAFGTMTNRVAVDKPLNLFSVNGPQATIIQGYRSIALSDGVRCVYLTDQAVMSGFTLTNGSTHQDGSTFEHLHGGGVFCASPSAIVSNCIISGSIARSSGGGAYSGTLIDCSISNNVGVLSGGGASESLLVRCLVSSNSATRNFGGGTANAVLNDCQIIGNTAGHGAGCNDSVLTNCIVMDNAALFTGGGVRGGAASHSILSRNSAQRLPANGNGGGALNVTLINCLLTQNFSTGTGGGVEGGLLINCTVVSNSASVSGGGIRGTASVEVQNSIIYFNSAPSASNTDGITSYYTCTTPTPTTGIGNITNAPLFVDWANLRLQSNSPCINAGNNSLVVALTDLDGNPRIAGGPVDIGAYEYQSPLSMLSYAWLQQYGLPTDGSADFVDTDSDGMNNYGEWRSDTDPSTGWSVLKMIVATNSPTGATLTWQSVATRNYWLERATNLSLAAPFQTVATNIPGAAGSTTYTDSTATDGGPYFYRVRVQ